MKTMTFGQRAIRLFLEHNALVMLLILVVVSSAMSDAFLSGQNVTNLLRQLVPLLLVSIGMLLVILTGGIDLSVGSVAAVGGVALVLVLNMLPGGGAGWLAYRVDPRHGICGGHPWGSDWGFRRFLPYGSFRGFACHDDHRARRRIHRV